MRTLQKLGWLALSLSGTCVAQGLPQTDIWLAGLSDGGIGDAAVISDGRGYNNQPHFSADGSTIFYTRELTAGDGTGQTDIAAFDIGSGVTTAVNATVESEYSPTPVPGRNAVSVIQVEADGKQRLWSIDLSDGGMELLLADAEPVGYHTWINQREVAMFILGDSFTLQLATLGQPGARLAANNIGRSLRTHPASGEVLFVDKNQVPWRIAAYDPENAKIRGVMPLFPGSEDFTVDGNGVYWTGNGSKLYRRAPGDGRWQLVADLRASGVSNISRLALDPDVTRVAIVSDR